MKYKYSRSYYVFQVILGLVLGAVASLLMLKYFMPDDTMFRYKLIITEIIGVCAIISIGSRSWLNKFIELKENHIHFHSYQDGGVIDNYDVKYEDIDSIYVKTLPLIGISRIDLHLKNGDLFEIANTYGCHKELFYNLTVKLQNEKYTLEIPQVLQELTQDQSGDGSSS